ncbi:MAG TPA: type II secretion system F family protein [Phycisphaerae bacterium]|nr:type II secretion system F family protein [Phycisphaerae bacterium]
MTMAASITGASAALPPTGPAVRYAYQARDQKGQTVSGVISAASLPEATRALRAEGKYVLDIKPAKPGAHAENLAGGAAPLVATKSTRVSREELINFTMQLSVMVDTGVPLSDALHALSEQVFSEPFIAVLKAVDTDVTGGKDISASFERFPKVFPHYYISLVRASELSGTMGPMLRKLADYLVSQRETAKKVKGAMIYPSFMFVMSIGVTIFLLTVILPKFTAIFASRKAALPMPTQVLMAVSHSLIAYWYLWILGIAAISTASYFFFSTPTGKRTADSIKLKTPIFGPMFHKLYLSRSLSTMGTMISSGVQLLDCLGIVKDVSGNIHYQDMWEDVRTKVQNGAQLSEPLLKSPLMPKSIAQMISSGEKTGELPNVLNRISSYMEEDLRTAIKTATQFIEPVMIGLMGMLIGGVAIAMLMPILTISKVMAQ